MQQAHHDLAQQQPSPITPYRMKRYDKKSATQQTPKT
jgi:hypothetical protein